MLQIVECTARYGASQLRNGATPQQAREIAAFIAGELERVAEALRALTGPDPAERALARQLASLGWGRRQIAARLGVTEPVVRRLLRADEAG
jgi:hypothetical protein